MRSPPNRKSKRRYRDEKIEPVALAGFVVSEFLIGNYDMLDEPEEQSGGDELRWPCGGTGRNDNQGVRKPIYCLN